MQFTAAQFLDRPLNALSFYDILPTDGVTIVDGPPLPRVDHVLRSLSEAREDVPENLLNQALLVLLAAPPLDPVLGTQVADHLSCLYAGLLSGGKRDRGRRMKLQQLNFFFRDLLDREVISLARSTPADGGAPWDWLPVPNGEISIFSGAKGLRWTLSGISDSADVGFPSQLDPVDSGRISVGSIFSPGAAIFDDGRVARIENESPLVLIFSHDGEDWAVSYDGVILRLADGGVMLKLDSAQVDRVRLINGQLFISDWTEPGVLHSFDLASRRQERIDIAPIILLNDLCRAGDHYYAICKQQGRVFAFDTTFRLVGDRLGFGRGAGRLFDPLTIRYHAGELHVLNWVTATKVTLPLF